MSRFESLNIIAERDVIRYIPGETVTMVPLSTMVNNG